MSPSSSLAELYQGWMGGHGPPSPEQKQWGLDAILCIGPPIFGTVAPPLIYTTVEGVSITHIRHVEHGKGRLVILISTVPSAARCFAA